LPGTTVQIFAASSCEAASYQFWLKPPGGASQLVRDWDASPAFSWATEGAIVGTYEFEVRIRKTGATEDYQARAVMAYELALPSCLRTSYRVSYMREACLQKRPPGPECVTEPPTCSYYGPNTAEVVLRYDAAGWQTIITGIAAAGTYPLKQQGAVFTSGSFSSEVPWVLFRVDCNTNTATIEFGEPMERLGTCLYSLPTDLWLQIP